jgi:predicted DNA-binding transcriptional regulator YafY
MSVNKYAVTRYHVLDRCFGNLGKKFFIEDLLTAINETLKDIHPETNGIKVRQLYDDIKYMQSPEGYDAPIEKLAFGKRKYYRYSESKFSIHNAPLKEAEINKINAAIDIITRFKGMPQFEWINELTPKLQQAFTLSKNQPSIISFDSNEYLKGIEFIGVFFQAILNRKVLSINYRSFKAKAINRFVIHPYYLKQYNNRWFIFGLKEGDGQLIHLALDRINSVTEETIHYRINASVNFDEFFDDIVGVSNYNRSKVELVALEIADSAAPYILSKPLHGSQKIKQKVPLIITIEVKLNKELESLLLSFGERIKVLSPTELLKKLQERLKSALEKYP